MKKTTFIVAIFYLFLGIGCSDDAATTPDGATVTTTPTTTTNTDWRIPEGEVFDGGPGKDGIPSVDRPGFYGIDRIDFLDDNDLVVAVNYGEEAKAYPHPILDWHEIINDRVGDRSIALTYCPLTGTGIGWDRMLEGEETTFGVSGLLYNSNLLPYDRATDSYWSQMRHDCVKGALAGNPIKTHHVVEMSYQTFKEMYPEGQVMNTNTGFSRSYTTYPYGGYRTNEQIIFPITKEDDRYHKKERVLGVVADEAVKTYAFENFPGAAITVIEDQFAGTDLVVVGSTTKNFLTAYSRTLEDGTSLTFEAVQDQFPIVMKDNEGTEWDAFGNAINGPRTGTSLSAPLNYIGYWFAWVAFNEELSVF